MITRGKMKIRHVSAAALVLASCGSGQRTPPRPAPVVVADVQPAEGREVTIPQPMRTRTSRVCIDCGGWGARPEQPLPLYVVDGRAITLPAGTRSPLIDPARIQAIEVLKGADAVQRFGSAATGGAVLIKLKH